MTIPTPDERMAQLRRAIDDYPAAAAQAAQRVAVVAAQTVTGQDGQAQVTVTVTGDGRIEGVRVDPQALREWDNHTLAEHLTAAVNDGLDRVDELTAAGDDPAADLAGEEAMRRYEQQMDEVLYNLNCIDRRLDRFLD